MQVAMSPAIGMKITISIGGEKSRRRVGGKRGRVGFALERRPRAEPSVSATLDGGQDARHVGREEEHTARGCQSQSADGRSIVIQNRAGAAALGEQRVAAVVE